MITLDALGLGAMPEEFGDTIENVKDSVQELEDFRAGRQSAPESHNVKPIVKTARQLLNRRLRVGVDDGRVFVGKFLCLDKQQNIILYDTLELRNIPGSKGMGVGVGAGANPVEKRSLGLVLIPPWCRTSCQVECSSDEKMDVWSLGSLKKAMDGDEGALPPLKIGSTA